MSAITDGSGTVMISPIELIIEQPINIGCFQMSSGEQETQLGSIQDCLIHCHNIKMRFAVMISGDKCSCISEINHDDFEELPHGRCNRTCVDYTLFPCGGINAASLYTAGMHCQICCNNTDLFPQQTLLAHCILLIIRHQYLSV